MAVYAGKNPISRWTVKVQKSGSPVPGGRVSLYNRRSSPRVTKHFTYIWIMEGLANIKRILTGLKPVPAEKYHVSSIGLFGSIVRDDYKETSDIDIIVDFSRPIGIEFVDLADFMEKRLNRPVDLVSKKGIKEKYYKAIASEIVYV